jgi:hypothetical protein
MNERCGRLRKAEKGAGGEDTWIAAFAIGACSDIGVFFLTHN